MTVPAQARPKARKIHPVMMRDDHRSERLPARALGLRFGVLPTGSTNCINDIPGVRVGHVTLHEGDSIRTGVTAIIPADGNLFQSKVPAAVYVGNGYGKLAGALQVNELGNLETPIVLTNTLSVAPAIEALIDFTLAQPDNEDIRSVNALVGETNDGVLNDIRARVVRPDHVRAAIDCATAGAVQQGCIGAGTGTVCFGFKGGIGTSSRKLTDSLGGYTLGVLVQSNFGGVLTIDGAPVGREMSKHDFSDALAGTDGSCMIIVATDAPLDHRNLRRLAKRAFMGLARTGGIAANGSGDFVIAFSTHPTLRVPHRPANAVQTIPVLSNDAMSPLFLAAIEATEEAIINSLFASQTTTGNSRTIEALPLDRVLPILQRYNRIQP